MKNTYAKKLFKEFTHSEWVVYLLLIISVINVLAYLNQNNLTAIAIFLSTGFIVSRYTKNMIYVLLSAIVITNLFVSMGYLNSLGQKTKFLEGMSGKDDEENTSSENNSRLRKDGIKTASAIGVKDLQTVNGPTKIVKEATSESFIENDDSPASDLPVAESSHTKNSGSKATPTLLKEDKKSNKINTVKQEAFAEQMQPFVQQLQKMMGEGGFDMKQLKNQQEDLLKAMQQMKPIIDGAEGMINKVAGGPLGSLLGIKN